MFSAANVVRKKKDCKMQSKVISMHFLCHDGYWIQTAFIHVATYYESSATCEMAIAMRQR